MSIRHLGVGAALVLTLGGCAGAPSFEDFNLAGSTRAECAESGDTWICRDVTTDAVCHDAIGDPCQTESQCSECACKCYTAPGKRGH